MPENKVIRIYLVLLLVIIAYYALRSFQKAPPEKVARILKIFFYVLLAVMLIVLAVTGHLNGLFALLGILVAFVVRMLPVLMRYAPYLHRVWLDYINAKNYSSGQHSDGASPKAGMTKAEAYDVLGLKSGASEQDIVAAHRKLIQKIHPDRGGSDYLAAKINLAKKTLLNK